MWLYFATFFLLFIFAFTQCPDGFTQMQSNPNKCYKYYADSQPIEPDYNTCDETYLLTIDSPAENTELLNIIGQGSAWIGLFQDPLLNGYEWLNGDFVNYTNLGSNCSLIDGSGSYFYISPDGLWRNCVSNYTNILGHLCGAKYGGLPACPIQSCPGPNYNVQSIVDCKCYWIPTFQYNDFDYDGSICVTKGVTKGSFNHVIIDSSFANNELVSLTRETAKKSNCTNFFIGYHSTNNYNSTNWAWDLGNNGIAENSTYTNWHVGYPVRNKDYGYDRAMISVYDGTWINEFSDYDNLHINCIICQYRMNERIA